jgi:hypothetical protein
MLAADGTAPDTFAWSGWIEPTNLCSLVRNTAPFLFSTEIDERGQMTAAKGLALGMRPSSAFLTILRSAEKTGWTELTHAGQLERYFELCLAAHHSTVATFVPTDVDTKIRGLIWRRTRDRDLLRRLGEVALAFVHWDLSQVSRRTTEAGSFGPVSGHDGEWLSVMAGAHGRFLQTGDSEWAELTGNAIDAELRRELAAFEWAIGTPGAELDTLRLAASVTHNLGDLDQGISFWEGRSAAGVAESLTRFHRIAHENRAAFGGAFLRPTELYKKVLATEGHRNYPLRAVKPLRQSPDLLLPLGPYLDDWGGVIGSFPGLSTADRSEVLDALIRGCRKIPGQQGYYRALAGFAERAPRAFEDAAALLPSSSRKDLRSPEVRRLMAVPRASFESRLRKVVQGAR